MFKRKADVVAQNTKGIEFLMKKNKINVVRGSASFSGPNELKIEDGNGKVEKLEFKNVLLLPVPNQIFLRHLTMIKKSN